MNLDDVFLDFFVEVGFIDLDCCFCFSFLDFEGERVLIDDECFVGKLVFVDIFGIWCFNCNDVVFFIV